MNHARTQNNSSSRKLKISPEVVSKLGETGFGGTGVPVCVLLDTGTEACATGTKKVLKCF